MLATQPGVSSAGAEAAGELSGHLDVDGHAVGTTPIRALPAPAGRRRVVLKDGQGRVLRAFVTTVRPGHTTVHSFDSSRNR